MADKYEAATQPGVVEGETLDLDNQVDTQSRDDAPRSAEPLPKTERELAMERVAASRNARFEADNNVKLTPEPEPTKVDTEPTKEETTASQIGKQLDDGTFVLDAAALDKVMVVTKVNGVEELVPATKALGQYQKSAAADVKLQEAVRISNEANDRLRQANERLAAASTPKQEEKAQAEVENAKKQLDKVKTEVFDPLFEGDTDKASAAFQEAVKSAVQAELAAREPGAPALDNAKLVDATVQAVTQRLAVKSALTQLFIDYPEINKDADMALIAENHRKLLVDEGKDPEEAIKLAGDYVGEKFKIGKFAVDKDVKTSSSTTREQKLAAKQRLDEPESTAARAASATPLPQTPSQVIAEMRAARQTQ